jgi:diguanylate cyclase (GGDEF)-like protein
VPGQDLRVLIADDDPVARRVLEAAVGGLGHVVTAVADGEQALEQLAQPEGPGLAILDWQMPGLDGLAVCRAVRQQSERYVYIVLLTAKGGLQHMLEAFAAEVDDFLVKPVDIAELRARLRVGERLLRLQRELRHRATHDMLTDLPNRRAILANLDAELSRARRANTVVSVALADLDHFKEINDGFGHLAGDAAIRESGGRMRAALRTYDSLGRYGGEEFLMVLPECDLLQACGVADRVRAAIADGPIREVPHPITVSIGVTSTTSTGFDSDALLRSADEALYRAKSKGRNRVAA